MHASSLLPTAPRRSDAQRRQTRLVLLCSGLALMLALVQLFPGPDRVLLTAADAAPVVPAVPANCTAWNGDPASALAGQLPRVTFVRCKSAYRAVPLLGAGAVV